MNRCPVCGMQASPELKREFEGETYFFHTGLCMITFEIQIEKIIVERNRFLEESRKSLGLSMFHDTSQLNEAVMAERERALECACQTPNANETLNWFRSDNGDYNDTH